VFFRNLNEHFVGLNESRQELNLLNLVLFTRSSHHKRQYAGQHQKTSREKVGGKNIKMELETAMSRQLRIRLRLGIKLLAGEVA
jgi:hypothetical protein